MALTALEFARDARARLVALVMLVAVVTAALSAATDSAGAAPTATATGVYRGGQIHGAWPAAPGGATVSAGLIQIQLADGTLAWAYCVEINRNLDTAGNYDAASWATAGVSGLDVVSYILAAYGPSASPPRDTSFDAAAVQAAIWHFTDGFELGGSAGSAVPANGNPAQVIALYDQILADVADGIPAQGDPHPAITLTRVAPTGTVAAGDVVRFTVAGSGLAGVTVSLAPGSTGATFVDCAAPAGPITPSVPNGGDVCVRAGAAGTFTLQAVGQGSIRYGTTFVQTADPSRQRLVLGQTVVDRVDASASVAVIPAEGSITVSKEVIGSSGLEGAWNIEVLDNSGTVVRTGQVDALDPTITFTGLPASGSPYTVREVGSSATSVTVTGNPVTVTPGGDAAVTVTNRYEGRFTVTKDAQGTSAPPAGTTFSFEYACTAAGQPGPSGTFDLVDGGTFTSPMVLAGSTCTVTETDSRGGAPSVRIGGGPATPGDDVTVTIVHGTQPAVVFVNLFPDTPGEPSSTTTTSTAPPPSSSSSSAPPGTSPQPVTPSAPSSTAPQAPGGGTLAFTGGEVGLLLLWGTGLVTLGLVLRTATRRRSS